MAYVFFHTILFGLRVEFDGSEQVQAMIFGNNGA
jgi:hypothetical protein